MPHKIDWSNNPPKMFLVLFAFVCVTVLLITNNIEGQAGVAMLSALIGYAVGNGIAAKQGDPVEPLIGSKDEDEPKKN